MSELAEDMNAWRQMKQEKRASNREHSTQMLRDAGIQFVSKNNGAHLILKAGAMHVDFWPGTGLWLVLGSKHKHRGVSKLIKYVKKQQEQL